MRLGDTRDSTDTDDARLVERTLAGDSAAYAVLMRRHFDSAFAVARRLTASEEDAEDACQEAFTRGYFRLQRCGDPTRFHGWLLQIVRHHAHNVRRYQALRAAASLGEATQAAAAADVTSRSVELRDLRERLRAALATLSDVQRSVVRRHDIDGWTHPQIATELGISVVMSRRHLSDARKVLRSQLGDAAIDFLTGGTSDE